MEHLPEEPQLLHRQPAVRARMARALQDTLRCCGSMGLTDWSWTQEHFWVGTVSKANLVGALVIACYNLSSFLHIPHYNRR